MANRSDFLSATLPRRFKRMLALQTFPDAHAYGAAKRLWIDAHAHAKRCKQRMNSSPGHTSSGDDTAEAAG